MYRLLVVDNEPIIVESVLDLLHRTEVLDLELYGKHSPLEALKLLESMRFDIVLTDIRMPGMSGIELHREIIQHWPWCKVIFLTGYNDFEFIQEVIRNGGTDYLLKTEGDQAIIRAVEKAIQALSEAIEMENLIHKSREQLHKIQPYLQKELLWELVLGEHPINHTLHQQFHELSIPLRSEEQTLIVIGRVDKWNEGMTSIDKSLLLFAIQNIAEEYLAPSTKLVSISFEQKTKMVWLIQGGTTGFIRGAIEMIQTACRQLLKLRVSFAIGAQFRDWLTISEQFENLQWLLSRGLGLGHELLLLEQQGHELETSSMDRELRKQLNKLKLLQVQLDHNQRHEFFEEYTYLMSCVDGVSARFNGIRLEIYFTLVSIFTSYLNRSGTHEEISKQINLGKMTVLNCQQQWREVVDYFYQLANILFDHKMSSLDFQEDDVIRQVQLYVRNNLAGDLSLNRIGEVVGHNPSYLSRLYKQNTNESLSIFIMEERIVKAKELLQENRLKIQDISKAVGFLSEQSFYRFFRKATGMTPQECRERVEK